MATTKKRKRRNPSTQKLIDNTLIAGGLTLFIYTLAIFNTTLEFFAESSMIYAIVDVFRIPPVSIGFFLVVWFLLIYYLNPVKKAFYEYSNTGV